MATLEICPSRGTYTPGSTVQLRALAHSSLATRAQLSISVYAKATRVDQIDRAMSVGPEGSALPIEWQPPGAAPQGYGVEAVLTSEAGAPLANASSAFDVRHSWTDFPRYGFVADFSPGRQDLEETFEALARFHINGLQFYDWQHRHDQLLPSGEDYDDPLGRRQSLATVRRLIEACRRHGTAAMAYLAVYAASAAFWEAHPAWALYDAQGKPIPFGERFLGLMNPSSGSPWSRHLLGEAERALDALGFDGLHIDQYGEPRIAFDASGREVDLPAAFASFVNDCKGRRPQASVVFNTIDGWPSEVLANSEQDFAYLEVWPRHPTYGDLRRVLEKARLESGGRPLVVAQYIPADRADAIRQVDALIASLGGTRIEVGEAGRLLTDPYFPNHSPLPPSLAAALRRHYDFVVRFGDLIGPGASSETDHRVDVPRGVWAFPRRGGWLSCVLVNMTGIETARWDQAHPPPSPLAGFSIEMEVPRPVRGAWWASPDGDAPGMLSIPSTVVAGRLTAQVPALARWGFLACELAEAN